MKWGLDPQESFTKMDKDQNVKNRIRGQVMHLNPPIVKKAPKEIGNGKTEASKNKGMKYNRFIQPLVRRRLPIGSPPMNQAPGLKKMLFYKTEQIETGTLTRFPLMGFRAISARLARLPPSDRSLGSHGNEEKMILSCFTLGGLRWLVSRGTRKQEQMS